MDTTYQKLFRSEDSFATTLVVTLLDEFGPEVVQWLPETIIAEIGVDFHVMPIQGCIDRIMAGIHIITNSSFYTSLPDFNDLCNVLSGEISTPGTFVPADAASCAWGITEAMLIAPPDDLDNAFSEEIKAYVGQVVKSEGILTPPDVLRISHFDPSLPQKVRYDFSDDEVMFQAIFQTEQGKTEDINNFIKNRLRALIDQLSKLHLKQGNVGQLAEKMLRTLPEEGKHNKLPSTALI